MFSFQFSDDASVVLSMPNNAIFYNQCNLAIASLATKVTHTQIARYKVTVYPQRLSLCHTVNVIQCNKHQLAYIATQTMQSRTQNIPFFPLPSTKPAENVK